jgi:hypothetical protein
MIDTMTASATKLANNASVSETLGKGSDIYKTWLDNQLSFMNEQTSKMKDAKSMMSQEELTVATKQWMDNQMKMTKEFMEFSMNTMKTYFESTLKSFPVLNGNAEKVKTLFNENMDLFSQWNDTINRSYSEMMKDFTPGTAKDAMKGMFNMSETYGKFAELWAPFVKSLQDKTFNADTFKNMMNPTVYKEMFDKVFNYNNNPFASWQNLWNNYTSNDWMKNWTNMMTPSSSPFNTWTNWMNNSNPMGNWNLFNQPMNPMNDWMKMFGMQSNPAQEWMKNMSTMFNQQNWMGQFQMPGSQEMFSQLMANYNNAYATTQQWFAPMFRMMTPNQFTTNIEATSSLFNKMMQFNIRCAEMQYMTYTTGSKAMQKVAERMQERVAKGEEFKGMNALYTEWLNTSDKVFVELFESEAYSKVQAEVASLQHTIRKEAEVIMEKMMSNVPVITRSEMDDNYKAIHDMKKRISELEKALASKETPAPVKKATK